MAEKRVLYLEDFLEEIHKTQSEIGATRESDPAVIAMHNGLTLATALAYKVTLTRRDDNG